MHVFYAILGSFRADRYLCICSEICGLSDMSDKSDESDESDESDSPTKKIKKPPYGSFLMIWDYSIFNKVK